MAALFGPNGEPLTETFGFSLYPETLKYLTTRSLEALKENFVFKKMCGPPKLYDFNDKLIPDLENSIPASTGETVTWFRRTPYIV